MNTRSLVALALSFMAIVVVRWSTLDPRKELSWDVFGYYLYAPSVFIHGDLKLDDISWIHDAQQTYGTTETLYQITDAPDGSRMFFFLMGMSILYSPFFLIGHLWAFASGAPMDGFSEPYQWALGLGGTLYSLIGLYFLRRILLRYFSDVVTAAVIIVIVLGTNYFQFSTIKNLETANFLFTGVAWMTWSTIRWHETFRRVDLIQIAIAIGLITLVKPSEIICGLVPLLWGIHDRTTLTAKVNIMRVHRRDLMIAILIGLFVLSPQLIYWKWRTGQFIYDSYRNPGVGLDLFTPHIWETLFSFRKGWLIYTPIMLLALIGIPRLRKTLPHAFLPVLIHSIVAFWIISSWSEWWYGASFSIRPMITLYPLLAIPLGITLQAFAQKGGSMKIALATTIVLLIGLNLFQMWQLNNWVIHPYRTTTAYYWKVFGRTTVPHGAHELLSVERRFDGKEVFVDTTGYRTIELITDRSSASAELDTLTKNDPFLPIIEVPYSDITSADHFWARPSAEVLVPDEGAQKAAVLVVRMERKEGGYGERTFQVPDHTSPGEWVTIKGDFMTPEIRSRSDRFKVYLWIRDGDTAFVRAPRVTAFLPD